MDFDDVLAVAETVVAVEEALEVVGDLVFPVVEPDLVCLPVVVEDDDWRCGLVRNGSAELVEEEEVVVLRPLGVDLVFRDGVLVEVLEVVGLSGWVSIGSVPVEVLE